MSQKSFAYFCVLLKNTSPHFQHQKKRSAPKNHFTGYLKAEERDAQRFLEKGRKLRPIGPK